MAFCTAIPRGVGWRTVCVWVISGSTKTREGATYIANRGLSRSAVTPFFVPSWAVQDAWADGVEVTTPPAIEFVAGCISGAGGVETVGTRGAVGEVFVAARQYAKPVWSITPTKKDPRRRFTYRRIFAPLHQPYRSSGNFLPEDRFYLLPLWARLSRRFSTWMPLNRLSSRGVCFSGLLVNCPVGV
jgi:hypothetical protein